MRTGKEKLILLLHNPQMGSGPWLTPQKEECERDEDLRETDFTADAVINGRKRHGSDEDDSRSGLH